MDAKDLELLELKIEKEIAADPKAPLAVLARELLNIHLTDREKLKEYHEDISAYDFMIMWAKTTDAVSLKYVGKEREVKFILKVPGFFNRNMVFRFKALDNEGWHVRSTGISNYNSTVTLAMNKVLRQLSKSNHLKIKKKEIF